MSVSHKSAPESIAARARAHTHTHTQCAGAVVGVSIFSKSAPEAFGAFDAAFMTLFYVTGGDPWPDSLQKNKEDGWRPPH